MDRLIKAYNEATESPSYFDQKVIYKITEQLEQKKTTRDKSCLCFTIQLSHKEIEHNVDDIGSTVDKILKQIPNTEAEVQQRRSGCGDLGYSEMFKICLKPKVDQAESKK